MKGEVFMELEHKLIIQQEYKYVYQKHVKLVTIFFETRSVFCILCVWPVSVKNYGTEYSVMIEIGYFVHVSDSLHCPISDSIGCLAFTTFPAVSVLWSVAANSSRL
jgi:hypothetical protein